MKRDTSNATSSKRGLLFLQNSQKRRFNTNDTESFHFIAPSSHRQRNSTATKNNLMSGDTYTSYMESRQKTPSSSHLPFINTTAGDAVNIVKREKKMKQIIICSVAMIILLFLIIEDGSHQSTQENIKEFNQFHNIVSRPNDIMEMKKQMLNQNHRDVGQNSFNDYSKFQSNIQGQKYATKIKDSHSALLHSATNQLMDVLNEQNNKSNMDDRNMKVTISVNNNDNNLSPWYRLSGLEVSPGLPLPNQKINVDKVRKRFKPSKQILRKIETHPHQISDLHCALYNGPEYSIAQDLVYWHDIPSDSIYLEPFYDTRREISSHDEVLPRFGKERDSRNKYLTFQPDTGGFNNNRMAFETALVLSVAMGRTLVLPPRHQYPLLTAGSHKDQLLSFDDFFHLDSLNKEYDSVNIITMEKFLIRERGQLRNSNTNEILFPPTNQTYWDGSPEIETLWNYLENVSYVAENWSRNECVVAFPSTSEPEGNINLMNMLGDLINENDGRPFPDHLDFQGKPVSPDAPSIERLREVMAGRSKLCLYTEEMQKADIVHFPTRPPKMRLLTQFYSFIYFEDWRQATWFARLVRDHLRYKDEIMCAAARIIDAVHQSSYSRKNPSGIYHSLHIRRNGFHPQNGFDEISTNEVLKSLSHIDPESALYVATDDVDGEFFKQIKERYKIFFLSDFQNLLEGLNPNFNGLIEQLVLAKGETFHGTFFSTFSGYVNRLRGYYSVQDMARVNKDGILRKSHYMPAQYRDEHLVYKAVRKPFYAREFPVSWREINMGIDEMEDW